MTRRFTSAVADWAITHPLPARLSVTRVLSRASTELLTLSLLAFWLASPLASAAETVSPRRLLELSDLGNPVVSPDGKHVAFRIEQASIESNTYASAWYVQAMDGTSPPRRVAVGGVPLRQHVNGLVLPSPARWSPDGQWIYYRARLNETVSVWRAAADGSRADPVTFDAADVRDFSLSENGRTLKYSVGATREEVIAAEEFEYDRGVRVDNTVNIGAGLFRSSRVEGRAATQRFTGGWFAAGPLLGKVPDRWKAVDLVTMTVLDLSASEAPVPASTAADLLPDLREPSKLAVHPDDGRIALITPAAIEDESMLLGPDELYVLADRRSGRPVRCTAEPCTQQVISDIQWRPGTDEVMFTTADYRRRRGRTQSIYGWNVSTGVVRPIVHSDGLVSGSQRYWDIPCGISSNALVCVAAEADRPPRLEVIDLPTGDRRILFEPNRGLETDIAATVPAKLIHWTDERGREFTGHLFEARDTGTGRPPPLFVNFYNCYGFLRGGVGDEWPLVSLAENGISALCINAIPEFRLDFVERHDQGRLAVESVVAHLSAAGLIDPTRVGMGGLSYGSEVTMWTLANSDVLAVASVSGVSATPTYYLFNSLRDAFRSGLKQSSQLGSPEETPERWRTISPAFHLDRIHAPILFQLPEQEYRMTLEYSIPLVRRHQGEIYVFPDEAHIKFQPKHKLTAYERNLDWFRFWLQGFEDNDRRKAEQYKHWSVMRERICTGAAEEGRTAPWYCYLN